MYGFIKFDVPGSLSTNPYGYLPTDYYFGGPLRGDVVGAGIFVVSDRELALLSTDLGEAYAPDLGLLAVRAVDCNGHPAAGVRIEFEDLHGKPGASWAVHDALAVRGVDAVLTPPTDESGVAGFTNVPPGTTQYRALLPDGRSYGESAVRFRPDALTMAEARPNYVNGR